MDQSSVAVEVDGTGGKSRIYANTNKLMTQTPGGPHRGVYSDNKHVHIDPVIGSPTKLHGCYQTRVVKRHMTTSLRSGRVPVYPAVPTKEVIRALLWWYDTQTHLCSHIQISSNISAN